MTTRQRIDAAREARLWGGQIIVPLVGAIATVATIPEVREWAKNKYEAVKTKVQKLFKK